MTGCGRFFEGTPKEMHVALNETLAALPSETKVYVRVFLFLLLFPVFPLNAIRYLCPLIRAIASAHLN